MKKKITKMIGTLLIISMIAGLSGCNNKKAEETTLVDVETTTATEEVTEETTETEAPPMPIAPVVHDYEVFNDGQEHELVFYINDEENKTYTSAFKSTDMFKDWGIKSISFPVTGILQSEPVVLDISVRDKENRLNYDWDESAVYDDSAWYPGAKSLFSCTEFFQVWRASTAKYTIDYNAPDPTAIFNAYYNFYDKEDYEVIKPDEINVIDEGNGVIGYKFMINKPDEWVTKDEVSKAYGYMYVRVDSTKDYVQCITCGNRFDSVGSAYVKYSLFHSAVFTNFDDIKEGDICTAN